MRFNSTPIYLLSLIIFTAASIGLYRGWFDQSQWILPVLMLWNFFTWTMESTARRSETQQRRLIAFMEATSRYNAIYVMATLSFDEEVYRKVHLDFERWLNDTHEAIRAFFSVEEAERFRVIGNETPATMVLHLNQLRAYSDANKQVLLQWLDVYGVRLNELMKQTPAINPSWWLTPLVSPKSLSVPPPASSPSPR